MSRIHELPTILARHVKEFLCRPVPERRAECFELLPAVLVRHIGGFLCWLDRTALKYANRHTSQCFHPDFRMTGSAGFRAILVQRLNTLGIDGERFCLHLKEHRCVLSGSLILQCMLGTSWLNTAEQTESTSHFFSVVPTQKTTSCNINVFQIGTPCKIEQIEGSIGEKCWETHSCGASGCYPYCHGFAIACGMSLVRESHMGHVSGEHLGTIGEWVCGGSPQLDIVTLNPQRPETKSLASLVGYIDRYFDFNFLKNMFDGTRLCVRDMDAIMMRTCSVDVSKRTEIHREAWEIEYKRMADDEPVGREYRIIRARATKYMERGFTVFLNYPSGPLIYGPHRPAGYIFHSSRIQAMLDESDMKRRQTPDESELESKCSYEEFEEYAQEMERELRSTPRV